MRLSSSLQSAVAIITLTSMVTGCVTSTQMSAEPRPSVSVAVSAEPPSPTPAPPPASIGPRPAELPPAMIGPRPAEVPQLPPPPAGAAEGAPVQAAPGQSPVTKPGQPATAQLAQAQPAPGSAAPPPGTPRTPAPPAARGRNIVLNFDNADIETVIQAASEIVGFNYVLAPDVRGKVTVQTAGRIPQEDVLGVLLAILEVHGFTAIKSGNLYKIVRIEGARERAVPTIVGTAVDSGRSDDEVITQIVSVRYASAVDMSTLLRPMISARGSLAAHRETNILIVTDTVANIRRLLDIVRLVDVEVALEELQIIPIRFADANELAAILNQLYQSGRVRPGGAVVPGAPHPGLPRPGQSARHPRRQGGSARHSSSPSADPTRWSSTPASGTSRRSSA
jgi:hypothetical protein